MSTMINWDRPMLERFKKVYNKTVEEKKTAQDTFMFDGHEFVVGYSKYLIEYLEDKLKK